MRITLFLDDLLGGGAARIAAILSCSWAEMGRTVTLLTGDDGKRPPHFDLHPAVNHYPLALRGSSSNPVMALFANIRRILKLRKAIVASRPDVVISFLDGNNVLCLIATRGLRGIPVLVCERTDPHERSIGPFWEMLRRLTYPWADCLVTQSRQALDYFPVYLRRTGVVIPNPVVPPERTDTKAERQFIADRKLLLTLGSLRKVKGHDMLIEAFAAISDRFPDWDLVIHGEGQERAVLEAQIQSLVLGNRVHLPGHTADVGGVLRAADIFVLPSRAEGFPNALAEAMACGLPVLSFDCASGPSELIRNEIDGVLVPAENVPALAAALAVLMGDAEYRARLAARAPDVLDRFSLDRIMSMWETALVKTKAARTEIGVRI